MIIKTDKTFRVNPTTGKTLSLLCIKANQTKPDLIQFSQESRENLFLSNYVSLFKLESSAVKNCTFQEQ